jgi:hypothetical protein
MLVIQGGLVSQELIIQLVLHLRGLPVEQVVVLFFSFLLNLQPFHIIVLRDLILSGVNDHAVGRAIDDDNISHFFEIFQIIHQFVPRWFFFFATDNFSLSEGRT